MAAALLEALLDARRAGMQPTHQLAPLATASRELYEALRALATREAGTA